MKNTFGNSLTVTLFGESHGSAVGAVIDGIAPGIEIDKKRIDALLSLRRPFDGLSTARKEPDEYVIHSGVFENRTTGTPLCILIPNTDTRSKDYGDMSRLARPSHADYTAEMKYHGFQDYRGGGHFSGRITAALVAVGGILIPALEKKGIKIGTHIKRIGGISDRDFDNTENDINALRNMPFAVLDGEKAEPPRRRATVSAVCLRVPLSVCPPVWASRGSTPLRVCSHTHCFPFPPLRALSSAQVLPFPICSAVKPTTRFICAAIRF